jgi:hypothetical protein
MAMKTDVILKHAQRAVDDLRAGRRAILPPMPDTQAGVVVRAVRRLLAGDPIIEETAD